VLTADRRRAVSELLHVAVARKFQEIGVPLIRGLRGQAEVAFGPVDLRGLSTRIHSEDALELVKEHTLDIIGEWSHLTRDFKLEVALVQAAEVYMGSALFGYALQRADARFRLEKLLPPGPAPGSLRDYVASFGPEEAERAMSVDSLEAEAAVERHVRALFGSLRQLRQELFEAIGDEAVEAGSDQAMALLKQAVLAGKVASVRISVGDLRRLTLEGTAFGRLLADAEAEVDALHGLTPRGYGHLLAPCGAEAEEDCDYTEVRRTFAWPRGFQMFRG